MPTAPGAIARFLEYRPLPPPIPFRGSSREQLLDIIERVGDHELLTKTEPYRHQLEGLAFSLWSERALLYYEMRTGKTKIALDYISYLVYSGLLTRRALVIAHAPIGVDVWEAQIKQHSYLNALPIRSGGYTAERFFYALRHEEFDILLIAWSTLQTIFSVPGTVSRGARKGKPKLYADRASLRDIAPLFDAVVIDEIHMAGHHDTLRHIIASELVAQCRWRLGLTGTPLGRDPLLLWGQAALTDGGKALGASYHFFREAFCNSKYNPFAKMRHKDYIFDNKKMPILRSKMSAMSLHCQLRDVQDVNVLNGVVQLPMSDKEQARAYNEAIDRLVQLKRGDVVEIDNVFVRLRQIASGFLPFEDTAGNTRIVDFVNCSKLLWLDDLISDLPIQTVIFHEFIHSGELICQMLDRHKVKYDWLHGGTKERPALLERFRTGKTQVLVANLATGGMAVDMSAADYLLFYESSPSVLTRKQASSRASARGDRPLAIDDLINASVEVKILAWFDESSELQEALRRDPRRMAEELRRN